MVTREHASQSGSHPGQQCLTQPSYPARFWATQSHRALAVCLSFTVFTQPLETLTRMIYGGQGSYGRKAEHGRRRP